LRKEQYPRIWRKMPFQNPVSEKCERGSPVLQAHGLTRLS
jgi:hypothetical protein